MIGGDEVSTKSWKNLSFFKVGFQNEIKEYLKIKYL